MYGEVKQIKQMIEDMNRGIHTCIPGKITKVNSSDNTIDIQPAGKYKKPDGTYIDYPELKGVPIVQMQGSGQKATIQFPIKKDDGVMVFFSEQQLDQWRDGEDPKTDLRHDLTSAIAIPGLMPKANDVHKDSCDDDAIIIDYDGKRITVKDDSIECKVNGTTLTVKSDKVIVDGNLQVNGSIAATELVYAVEDVRSSVNMLNIHAHESIGAPPAPPIPSAPPFSLGE